jgi:O-antigen ligase
MWLLRFPQVTPDIRPVEARRPQALEAGLFLLVVALPLAFFPQSRSAFLDVKILVLATGTLLVWSSGLPVDRRLALPSLVWTGVVSIAAFVGVDPVESLFGTVRGTGLVMLLCVGALVALAPNVQGELLERARGWLVVTGMVVAAVVVVSRLAPDVLEVVARRTSFLGSTFGNPVPAAAFIAACIPAVMADRRRRLWVVALAVYGLGMGAAEERSAYLLPIVALAAAAWYLRPGWRRLAVAAGVTGVALALWAFAPASVLANGPSERYTAVGQFQTLVGERQRLAVYEANARAFAERPVLGWGPANAWTGFLSAGTADQIDTAGRNWADAHNLLLEMGVVSGAVGLLALGWLLLRLVPRALRPGTGRGWAAASALTLAAFACFEPMNVVLTPLLFLLAGASAAQAAEPSPTPVRERRSGAIGRTAATVALACLVMLAGVNLTASGLEEWGHTHSDSNWALRSATGLAPWRLTATEALAISLAVDGRAGDEASATEAREVVDRAVRDHPMNPGVRLLAADVELLLRNFPATQRWIREQLQVFPNDDLTVPEHEPGVTIAR